MAEVHPCDSMNADVSGIGVRLSFYLQALFLGCLSARSSSIDEITGSLYTLIATNVALAVTSLILGLKPQPEMSFHDALVVFYLLTLSWATVVCSLPSVSHFPTGAKVLQVFSVVHSYIVFAFVFAFTITADTFGSYPECNGNAVLVLFRPFSALKAGRILILIVLSVVVASYSVMTYRDYFPASSKMMQQWVRIGIGRGEKEPAPPPDDAPEMKDHDLESQEDTNRAKNVRGQRRGMMLEQPVSYDLQISGDLIVEIIIILILWALTVMNTELLINWNHFEPSDDPESIWQFGQVLPLFLVILPFVNMIGAFKDHGFRKLRN